MSINNRITVALLLSLVIHAAVISFDGGWLGKRAAGNRTGRRVTISLAPRKMNPIAVPENRPQIQKNSPQQAIAPKPDLARPAIPPEKTALIRPEPLPKIKAPVSTIVREIPPPKEEPEPETGPATKRASNPASDGAMENIRSARSIEHADTEQSAMQSGNGVIREAFPLYRENPAPAYPALARWRRYQGTVLLDVLVDSEGKVGEARVLQTSGHTILDKAALAAVQGWRFVPGRRGEENIDMWVRIPVRFVLK
jgi:protein TonB